MSRHQTIIVISALVLTLVLYFGFGKVPKQGVELPVKETSDVKSSVLLEEAKEKAKSGLQKEQNDKLIELEKALSSSNTDSAKAESYKQLASFWYTVGKPEVSAYYAEKVSDITGDKEALQITGTTYRIAIAASTDEAIKTVCSEKAVKAFEKAIELDSSNVNYKMQLAMVYVDRPQQENPMKGILMLRELNTRYPDNVDVLVQLGKLAIQTGQFDKAIERLLKATQVSPQTPSIYCLLAEAYSGKGDKANAELTIKKCKK